MKPVKSICAGHFNDRHVKRHIKAKGERGDCEYCGKTRNVLAIDDLAEYLEECIETQYDEPYERGAVYNPDAAHYEDRFPFTTVYTTAELLQYETECDDWEIVTDIARWFSKEHWADIHGMFGSTEAEYLGGGWQRFKEIIKHEVRFMFFDSLFKSKYDDKYGEIQNPFDILKDVAKGIKTMNLFTKFKPGTLTVYRTRQHKNVSEVNGAFGLGPLPKEKAKANRMNPVGIPMFYGAFDKETCLKEVLDENDKPAILTTGQFVNLTQLKLVDFTKLRELPSLFNKRQQSKRAIAAFLLGFISDMSIPVKPDDVVHIEYVPTQVVTEFIKLVMGNDEQIDGIMYNSVKNKGGICIALFLNPDQIKDRNVRMDSRLTTPKGVLESAVEESLENHHILELDNRRLQRKRLV